MATIDLFSRRRKLEDGEGPEVYTYTVLPSELRVQIVHILREAIGTYEDRNNSYKYASEVYSAINRTVSREHGSFHLGDASKIDESQITTYILSEKDIEKVFDVLEYAFRVIEGFIYNNAEYTRFSGIVLSAPEATEELNTRLKQHGMGFEYIDGRIIRIDSQYIHSEAVKPALLILTDARYSGARQEFHNAFLKYQKGQLKDALVEALKAFESVLKTICNIREWNYFNTDTASRLIEVVLKEGLVPIYMQGNLNALKALLESTATPRNKLGGHGQGEIVIEVPAYFTQFALNMTASAIVFLVAAEAELPK